MTHTIYYNKNYNATGYAFDTTRKSAHIAASLHNHPTITITDPTNKTPHTKTILNATHDKNYIKAIKTGTPTDLADSQGFTWDTGIYTTALAHATGLVAAVDNVLTTNNKIAGSLSSGLHHARTTHGEGWCTFNGLAIATRHAHEHGAQNILILDFDAHGGGGTRSILTHNEATQIDVSVSAFDQWHPQHGTNDHYELATPNNYLDAIKRALNKANNTQWDLVIYNAGMDPANNGVTPNQLKTREELVHQWTKTNNHKLIYTLAGGYTFGNYTPDDITTLHRLTIDTLNNN
jgi:acetoin utilization deacetylase AcuC-like enzyme